MYSIGIDNIFGGNFEVAILHGDKVELGEGFPALTQWILKEAEGELPYGEICKQPKEYWRKHHVEVVKGRTYETIEFHGYDNEGGDYIAFSDDSPKPFKEINWPSDTLKDWLRPSTYKARVQRSIERALNIPKQNIKTRIGETCVLGLQEVAIGSGYSWPSLYDGLQAQMIRDSLRPFFSKTVTFNFMSPGDWEKNGCPDACKTSSYCPRCFYPISRNRSEHFATIKCRVCGHEGISEELAAELMARVATHLYKTRYKLFGGLGFDIDKEAFEAAIETLRQNRGYTPKPRVTININDILENF